MGGCVPKRSNIIEGNKSKKYINLTSETHDGTKRSVPLKLKKVISPFDMNYRIIHKSGEGSCFSTYKIQEKSNGERKSLIAIRRFSLIANQEAEFIKSIESFIRLKEHPNLIKLFEYYIDDINILIITELLVGNDLYQTLENLSSYCELTVQTIVFQISNGLQHIHDMLKTSFTDLHPFNVFLSVDTNSIEMSERIKTKVFYLSKRYFQEKTFSHYTPYYLPPESCFNSSTNSLKSDVWGLGSIMHLLYYSYPLFLGENDAEIKGNIQKSNSLLLSHSTNKHANELISDMIRVDPSTRIAAKEVLNSEWGREVLSRTNDLTNSVPNFKTLEMIKLFIEQENVTRYLIDYIDLYINNQNYGKQLLSYYNMDIVLLKSYNELRFGFEVIFGPSLADFELEIALEGIEEKRDGKVDYKKFIDIFIQQKQKIPKDNLIAALSKYNKSFDGRVRYQDLKNLLKKTSSPNITNFMNYQGQIEENPTFEDLVESLNKIYQTIFS